MRCFYCELYASSRVRTNGQRFCREKAEMVSSDDDFCEKFELTATYYCSSLGFCTDIKICTSRLNKSMDDCKRCKQKKDILEIRRFIGRKVIQSRPKINIRREVLCQETVETL